MTDYEVVDASLSEYVVKELRTVGAQLSCLGKTKHGHPRHSLYLPKGAELEKYP